jgi:hypothetical protein
VHGEEFDAVISTSGKRLRTFLGPLGGNPDQFHETDALSYRSAFERAARHYPGKHTITSLPWGTYFDDGESVAGYLTDNGLTPAESLESDKATAE